jgi:alanine dehydrogenase
MIVGILKERKAGEYRVAMTPAGVEIMKQHGHTVLVEKGAGKASGFEDADYAGRGAEIVDTPASSEAPEEIYKRSEMILRVKEPQPFEYRFLRPDQIYFSYLHLATSEELTRALMRIGSVNIAYETVQKVNGSLPLLTPMSEVAGAMAVQEGAKYLEMAQGGHGVLLGGVPGVDPGMVVILGGGAVGLSAAKTACGWGAKVYVLDVNLDRLRYLSDVLPPSCFVVMSSPATIRDLITRADIVIGATLVPGSRCPILVTREMLKTMKKGSVLVDVAIDQGGNFESSKETTHDTPTYIVEDVVHYAVSNMPGALPRSSTIALTNATLSYALQLADKGWKRALKESAELKRGANVVGGKVTYKGVADAFGLECADIDSLL